MLRVWYERLSRLVKFEGLTRNAVPEVKSSHFSMMSLMQNLGGTKKPSTLAQVRREWVQDIRKQPGNLRPPSSATSQVLGKKCCYRIMVS